MEEKVCRSLSLKLRSYMFKAQIKHKKHSIFRHHKNITLREKNRFLLSVFYFVGLEEHRHHNDLRILG